MKTIKDWTPLFEHDGRYRYITVYLVDDGATECDLCGEAKPVLLNVDEVYGHPAMCRECINELFESAPLSVEPI